MAPPPNLSIKADEDEEEDQSMAMVPSPKKGVVYRYPTRRESLSGAGAFVEASPQPTPINNKEEAQITPNSGTPASKQLHISPSSAGKRPSFLEGKSPSPKPQTPLQSGKKSGEAKDGDVEEVKSDSDASSSDDSDFEEVDDIPKHRNDNTMSMHALRLRTLIKEGRTKQTTIFFDKPVANNSRRSSRSILGSAMAMASNSDEKGALPGAALILGSSVSSEVPEAKVPGAGTLLRCSCPKEACCFDLCLCPSWEASLCSFPPERPADIRRRRSSIIMSTPIFGHSKTEAEKEDEKRQELEDRIALRDSKRKESVLQKEKRQQSVSDPKFAESHRRSILLLHPGEYEAAEELAVPGPLKLKTKKAAVTMFRRLPDLDRPSDEEAYEVACDNVYELTTIQKADEGWMCQNVLGQRNNPDGTFVKELCNTGNNWGAKKCKVCFAAKPRLRPFYKKLQRLSSAMKSRREELVEHIRRADKDQTRYEKDIELANFKLDASRRRREELEKEYYLFVERSGHSSHPMVAILSSHDCHSKFLEYLTCIANGELVGEDDDEPELVFRDEPTTPSAADNGDDHSDEEDERCVQRSRS